MAQSRPLLIPWLRTKLDSGNYPGVNWTNPERTEFCIPWKHALRQDSTNTDVLIFKAWAEVTGNGRAQGDASVWKRNFRSALRAKGFKMIADNKNDAANPHKVFRWPDESRSGGHVLRGQQQYPVPFEGAVGEAGLPEQPAHPMEGAVGGACSDHAEQFLHTMSQTNDGDHFIMMCNFCSFEFLETQFKVIVYYRGVKVSEQLVENESGVRIVYSLDQESGLSLISLPTPGDMHDKPTANLTPSHPGQADGLDVGYRASGVRMSKFDQEQTPSRKFIQVGEQCEAEVPFYNCVVAVLPPCSLFFCLGEKWPDPDNRPWWFLTSMELLKNLAVANGASSLQSVDLQMSLEEMMEMC
uniref:IRF tryptophan pentad repeat domain-containing protein n=1 Tax=Sphaeramia orbicularis TaxID=375764 RepID=A0A673ART9_9TELE